MMDLGAREPETGETGGEETSPHFPLVTYPPPSSAAITLSFQE
jgi:hypothetical protein